MSTISKAGPIAKAIAKDRAREPRLAGFIAFTLAGMIGGLVVLAGKTSVPQIIRAPGITVPLGNYTNIDSRDGGIVRAVYVDDGQWVNAGDVLVELYHPDLQQEADSLKDQHKATAQSLANSREILAALDRNQPLSAEERNALQTKNLTQALAKLEIYFESQRLMSASIARQQDALLILQEAAAFAQERAEKSRVRYSRMLDLHEKGLVSLSERDAIEDTADNMRAAASEARVRLAQERKAVFLSIGEREKETLSLREETLATIIDLEATLSQIETQEANVAEKIARLRLLAPGEGVVQSVSFPNKGEVIEPGETIFKLSPIQRHTVAETRIPSIEAGHVDSSQKVLITFDSFDVRRFGKVEGTLTNVSPVPLIDEMTGEQYFRATIELNAETIGQGAYQQPLTAGLPLTAELITGELTMLAYLLKPIQHTLTQAFTER